MLLIEILYIKKMIYLYKGRIRIRSEHLEITQFRKCQVFFTIFIDYTIIVTLILRFYILMLSTLFLKTIEKVNF